jgi:hypothetical protein
MDEEVVYIPKKKFIELVNILTDMYSAMYDSYNRLDVAYKIVRKLEEEECLSDIAMAELKDAVELARHLSKYYENLIGKDVLPFMESIEKEQILKNKQ